MVLSHSECRTKVCLVCFELKTCRPITGVLEKRVMKHLPFYDPKNDIYPNGICTNHRVMFGKIDQGDCDPANLPPPANFLELASPTKAANEPYLCEMCKLVRQNDVTESKGHPANPSLAGRPPTSEPDPLPPRGSKSICPRCLSWLGPGIPHPNPCEKYRRENLRKLLSSDTRFQEILASDVIREKMAASPKENTSISLLTMGTPYKIIKPSTYDSKAKYTRDG